MRYAMPRYAIRAQEAEVGPQPAIPCVALGLAAAAGEVAPGIHRVVFGPIGMPALALAAAAVVVVRMAAAAAAAVVVAGRGAQGKTVAQCMGEEVAKGLLEAL